MADGEEVEEKDAVAAGDAVAVEAEAGDPEAGTRDFRKDNPKMKISVASGKGGTGKTFVSTSLALSIDKELTFLDLDVEEPNAHIFIKPMFDEENDVGIPVPRVDYDKCDFCGVCQEVCAYNAIFAFPNTKKVVVFDELCKGCGACVVLCPQKALYEVPRPVGKMRHGRNGKIEFFDGKLNIGEINTTYMITHIQKQVKNASLIIVDSPPGTSCPMIQAVKDSDFVILVTEPTPFGLFDLNLAYEVVKKMEIPSGIIINRYGIGDDRVEKFAEENNIPILLKIPFSREIARYYSEGVPIVHADESWKEKFKSVFDRVIELVEGKNA